MKRIIHFFCTTAIMAITAVAVMSCGDDFQYPGFMPATATSYRGSMDAVMHIANTDYPVEAVESQISIVPEGDGIYTLSIEPFSMYFDGGFIKGDIVVHDRIVIDGIEAGVTSTYVLLNKVGHTQNVSFSMMNGEQQSANEMLCDLEATLTADGLEAKLYVYKWGTLPGTLTLRFRQGI